MIVKDLRLELDGIAAKDDLQVYVMVNGKFRSISYGVYATHNVHTVNGDHEYVYLVLDDELE